MVKKSLNGTWWFCCLDDEKLTGKALPITVPGSVLSGLLENEKIQDPFYRMNEYETRELFRKDYLFWRSFTISEEDLEESDIDLVCYGLDTIAQISINDLPIGNADNMHRTWRFSVKDFLIAGENTISITFKAPITYMESHVPVEGKEIHYVAAGAMAGNQYIRKAHSMFGWDWGPQLVDAGIWRDIELKLHSYALLDEVRFEQIHGELENGESDRKSGDVELIAHAMVCVKEPGRYCLKARLYEPRVRLEQAGSSGLKAFSDSSEPEVLYSKECIIEKSTPGFVGKDLSFTIEEPSIWWPNNLGDQPLYKIEVSLVYMGDEEAPLDEEGQILETCSWRLGLRTFTVSTDKDEWGNEFAYTVNGVRFFAMGADHIPEDSIYPRISKEQIEHLVSSAARSNFNTIRVWGGGYYPSDTFYDLCDEYGIIVWQDLMYACNVYEAEGNFTQSIVTEAVDNVLRLRHHASLGLWCGNNEIESAWAHWPDFCDHSAALKTDYIKMFEFILPAVINAHDPERFWWPSSPSSGGWIENPDDDNRGDRHYWDVWHGQKPFTDYRNFYFRFCSEFGFQSFPSIKTIRSFAEPEDLNIFSEVMESHQKNGYANGKILYYLSENFLYPKDFESLLYVTQIMQGLAIKFGVEHWRQNRGRCMGSIYWQLGDCWPVASWSSIDYFGRWKALQYMAVHFYKPTTISLSEEEGKVSVWLENESFKPLEATVTWKLREMDFSVIYEEEISGGCEGFSAKKIFEKDFSSLIEGRRNEVYLEATAHFSDNTVSRELVIFVPWKHLRLQKPEIQTDVLEEPEAYVINIKGNVFAPFVELDLKQGDGIFSDNYFHLADGEYKQVKLKKTDIWGLEKPSLEEIRKNLSMRSLRETY